METMVRETLIKSIVNVSTLTPEQVTEQVSKRLAKRRSMVEAMDSRFTEGRLTDIQIVKIYDLELDGYVVKEVVESPDQIGHSNHRPCAVGMFKLAVYNGETGRTGKRLVMIYPDGSTTEAFGGAKHVVKRF